MYSLKVILFYQALLNQSDGGIIFETQTIQRMEALILGALQWRMRSITPFSFVAFFIALMGLKESPMGQVLKNRASEIIFKSQRGIDKYDMRNDFCTPQFSKYLINTSLIYFYLFNPIPLFHSYNWLHLLLFLFYLSLDGNQ